jgi:hypothetical protein
MIEGRRRLLMPPRQGDRELLDLENAYWQAIKEKDVETVKRLTSDPCIVTGAQGAGRLDHHTLDVILRNAPWTLDAFTIKDTPEVLRVNDQVAVVAYHVREELTVEGQPVTLEAADASTWCARTGAGCASCTPSRFSVTPTAGIAPPLRETKNAPRRHCRAADEPRG